MSSSYELSEIFFSYFQDHPIYDLYNTTCVCKKWREIFTPIRDRVFSSLNDKSKNISLLVNSYNNGSISLSRCIKVAQNSFQRCFGDVQRCDEREVYVEIKSFYEKVCKLPKETPIRVKLIMQCLYVVYLVGTYPYNRFLFYACPFSLNVYLDTPTSPIISFFKHHLCYFEYRLYLYMTYVSQRDQHFIKLFLEYSKNQIKYCTIRYSTYKVADLINYLK